MTLVTTAKSQAIGELPVAIQASAPPMSVPTVLRGQTIRSGEQAASDENHAIAFEIVSIIGEGGMGIVYKAVQDYPCREVALKALKGALVETAILKRFEKEVSILALLRHPGICQLYSAGTLQDGSGVRVPFLAMELVHGSPIHQHCRKNRLNLRQKLELFLKVAAAVEYVHTTGIVHRDLSCRNILVNERGEPRVLDFGLATFADRRDHETSLATVSGHPFGTLQCASPEQAAGQTQAIDRQTDVYALGVALYKLLTGRHPLKLAGLSTAEVVRRIQEQEPSRLSGRDRKLRGDLETIVHKAMSKSKGDRYGSVAELAVDVRHYLANEPIHARPPSSVYLATKFVRRHRVLVTTALLIVLSLAVGLTGAVHEASRAREEAVRANDQARRANVEAARANLESRKAAIQLAEAKVAQGDALLLAEHFSEARDSYNAAWQTFDRTGESPLPAQLGIWELDQRSARPIREVLPKDNGVLRVAISPNQRWLAISREKLVEVRDVLSNHVEAQFDLKSAATELQFSPDGRFVAGLGAGRCVVWDVAAHKAVISSEPSDRAFVKLALGDGEVAVVTKKGGVTVRGFNGTELAVQFPIGGRRQIRNIAFTSDGSLYAIDGDWQIWKRATGEDKFSLLGTIPHTPADDESQEFFAISPRGGFFAEFGSEDAAIYSLPEFKVVTHWPAHVSTNSAGFASENTVYVSDAERDRYEIYDVAGQLRLVLPEPVSHVFAFSDDLAIVENAGNPILLWSTAPSRAFRQMRIPVGSSAESLSRDGRIAVLGGKDGLIRIYDAVDGHLLAMLDAGAPLKILKLDEAANLLVAVTQVDGKGGISSLIQFWDLSTLLKTAQFQESHPTKAFALAGAGTTALSCVFGEKSIRRWLYTGGIWSSTTIDTKFAATYVDAAPDQKSFLVTGDPDGVELWGLGPHPVRQCILPGSQGYSDALFCDNARLILAKGSGSKSFRIWQAKTHVPLGSINFSNMPGALAVSGGQEAIASHAAQLVVLDLQRQRMLRRLSVPAATSRILCMSDDGQRVLAAGNQPGAMLFDFSIPLALHANIDGLSRPDQARWFAACGVRLVAMDSLDDNGGNGQPESSKLTDAYIFWNEGNVQAAKRMFSSSHALGDGTRGLLLRGIQDESDMAPPASQP